MVAICDRCGSTTPLSIDAVLLVDHWPFPARSPIRYLASPGKGRHKFSRVLPRYLHLDISDNHFQHFARIARLFTTNATQSRHKRQIRVVDAEELRGHTAHQKRQSQGRHFETDMSLGAKSFISAAVQLRNLLVLGGYEPRCAAHKT